MIKQILFATAAFSVAIGATLTATGPALAQTGDAATTFQLSAAMRSVSLGEAMADAQSRTEFGLAGRPVHGVESNAGAAAVTTESLGAAPTPETPRLAMLDGFSIDEQRLGDIMIGAGIDIVRPYRMVDLASDDHDFGNTGFSEVDAFHTDPSSSQIGIRFRF
ncbi:hypothetical protein HFP57_15055 [Parasphingopyxis algicola]|uniref:hypothetical protein n=1 Tax=Parasphingopyxis algicola TaxID=2026624 RepID=UPI0015A48726|nr:hypothetical protein [Parasphingopyxis algicola]QLC26214.1 hypothetical protein HFP57_15055 [Parasphingopyxis algicola]